MAKKPPGSSAPLSFECFNINCYRTFPTERGLRSHLWHNTSCNEYMLQDRPYASCRETSDGTILRPGYGIQSTRLNPTMSTDAPFFSRYDEFDYDDDNSVVPDNNELLDVLEDERSDDELSMAAADIDESFSSPAITAIMERIKHRDRASMTALCNDVEHRCIVNLLKLLEDSQCPDYMLQSVLLWAYNSKLMGFDFNPKATTRKAHVQWMYKTLRNSHKRLPQVISLALEDHDEVQDVVCFDFVPALLSLLQDDGLMVAQNLVVNLDDPTSMYLPDDNKFGEANTGERYRELFRELITSRNQLLVPIILYLDGTAIDSKGHIEVCPVSFTTSLFSEKVRRDSKAWRLLAFVPDLNRGRSSAMNEDANNRKGMEAGRTTRNFHSVMDAIFKGMAIGQAGNDCRLKKVPLKVGDRWIVVDIVCPLLFVINDGKQGDQLCGRANGHHRSQRRHHRSCNCVFENLDNPDVKCTFLMTEEIRDVCLHADDDVLRNLTLYRVDNAFNRVQMGRNPHGIFMCAVIDIMHTVQHGIFMYAMEAFKKFLNPRKLRMLDRMAIAFDKTCCQSIRSSFPRTDFARGITNLTLVECSEQSGALFLFAALIMQVEAWQELDSSFPNLEAVLGTMECLLCFEAWLDQSTFWEIGDASGEAEAENAMALMMKLIVKWLPRQKGNEWKVSKFHEVKHIVRFIIAFGASRGYNASRPEEHHKAHAKRPGRRAQKNVKTIDQQCGRRIADAYIIDTVHALFQGGDQPGLSTGVEKTADIGMQQPVLGSNCEPRTVEEGSGTRYHIKSFRSPDDDNELCREVFFDTQSTGTMKLEKDMARFIVQSYSKSDLNIRGEGCIQCCTEYHKYNVDSGERLISLRCHPNYRSKGHPWYDWAIIRTENDDGSEEEYPSRILSCIPRVGAGGDMTYDLVVQFCSKPSGRESFLFTEWLFDTDYYVVSAMALVGLCFVLVSSEAEGKVLVVKDKTEWSSIFYDSANVVYLDP